MSETKDMSKIAAALLTALENEARALKGIYSKSAKEET